VREAERACFLSEGEESDALRKMGPEKWGLAPFFLGQKQRVFEPYSLSLSSIVAAAVSQKLCPEHSNQLSRKWRCLRQMKKNSFP